MSKEYLATQDWVNNKIKNLSYLLDDSDIYIYNLPIEQSNTVGASGNILIFDKDNKMIRGTSTSSTTTNKGRATFSTFIGPLSFADYIKMGYKTLVIKMWEDYSTPGAPTESKVVFSTQKSFTSGVVWSTQDLPVVNPTKTADDTEIDISALTGNYYLGIQETYDVYNPVGNIYLYLSNIRLSGFKLLR